MRGLKTTLALLAGLATMPGAHARQLGQLNFEKCELPVVGIRPSNPANAECTTFKVPEDRTQAGGRQIELALALVPSRAPRPQPDPVFILAGGPGQSAREVWRGMAGGFRDVLAERHVILLDQRGTGASNRFDCPLPDDLDPLAADLDLEIAAQSARECLEKHKDSHDARWYSTEDAAQDLDAVRAAIGAEKINLVGVSYGTRMGQIYAKRYPQQVRSIVLDSVVPNELILGTEHAINLEATLKAQLGRCRDDEECGKRFGDPYATLQALAASLRQQPRMLTARDPRSGESAERALTVATLNTVARMYMYGGETAALLPLTLSEAQAGRFEPLMAQATMMSDDLGSQLASGMHWSVLCAEDAPGLAPRPQDEGTLFGQDFIRLTSAWCAEWPRRGVPEDFHAPIAGDWPVLVVSGEFDPVTPPRYGDQVVKGLPNGRHLVFPGQGHSVIGRGCGPKLLGQFIAKADAKALDAECLKQLTPAPFFLNFSGSAP